MASKGTQVVRHVKPIISVDREEARKRALSLYRAWYRLIPTIHNVYELRQTKEECYQQLRHEFLKHAHVTDLRVIDMLLIKGHMDLKEAANVWKTNTSFTIYFKETWEKKPTDFMSKFLSGHD